MEIYESFDRARGHLEAGIESFRRAYAAGKGRGAASSHFYREVYGNNPLTLLRRIFQKAELQPADNGVYKNYSRLECIAHVFGVVKGLLRR